MLAPFFDDAGDVNQIALIEQLNLISYLYEDDRPGMETYLGKVDGGAIAYYDGTKQTLPPQVCVINKDQQWYIVIAGTTNFKQWLGNFLGVMGLRYDDGSYINAHMYFLHEMNRIWYEVLPTVMPRFGPGTRVAISGHSMGGAVGYLLANRFMNESRGTNIVDLITFAAPKSLQGGYLGREARFYARIVNEGDIVPYTPPNSAVWSFFTRVDRFSWLDGLDKWVHYGQRYFIDPTGTFKATASPENSFVEANLPDSDDPASPHRWPGYLKSLMAVIDKQPQDSFTPDMISRINDARSRMSMVLKETFLPFPLKSTYADPAALNSALGFQTGGPVTAANINSLLGLSAVPVNLLVPTRNIGPSPGPGGTVASGLWKITLFVNNGKWGRSFSSCWGAGGATTLSAALAKGKDLAFKYAALFGNNFKTFQATEKGIAAPLVEFLRATDAMAPRQGRLVALETERGNFSGWPGDQQYAADTLSTSLSLRMPGIAGAGAGVLSYANMIITGQPDDCVLDGIYDGTEVTIPTTAARSGSWDDLAVEFLKYLVANSFGFMGRDPAQADQPVESFAITTDGKLSMVITAHGYDKGDVIALKGFDVRGYPKKVRIDVPDANTIVTRAKVNTTLALPKVGTVFRVRGADGTRYIVFYKYQDPPEGYLTPLQFQVKVKKPGRQFLPVSFSKHGPRQKI
jgi:hypothetical protein